jgi:hypothetical protein
VVDRQQVLIPINSAEELSIVSINGKPEVAIVGPEGVYHNTVTFLSNEKDLRNFMKKLFGE